MDTSIAVAIIGLLGAGAVGGLGFILTGFRAELTANREAIQANGKNIVKIDERTIRIDERTIRIEERVGGLEERTISEFGQIKDMLTRIEATQAEQGRQIEKLSGGDLP